MADVLTADARTAEAPASEVATVAAAQRGGLTVADRVVEKLAEFAALDHPAVLRHASTLGRVTGRDLPRVSATVAGRQARVSVEIAVAWPAPLAETAAQVRTAVAEQISRLAGITVDRVDVSIRSVVHGADVQRRRVA